jgi:hypothetical protein
MREREKEPQFTVTDRRKFTSDGALRDGESSETGSRPADSSPPPESKPAAAAKGDNAPAAAHVADPLANEDDLANGQDGADAMPDPTAEESLRQSQDYHASARRLDEMLQQANAGASPGPQMDFNRLVQSLYMTAAVQMGAGTAPNEQPRIDILGARQSIDMLSVLGEKTKGNLSEEEKRLLQNALFDLRMSFLEITNAIASSAERGAKPGKGR